MAQVHVRTNDSGVVHQVDAIDPDYVLNFNRPFRTSRTPPHDGVGPDPFLGSRTTSEETPFGTIKWGPSLEGMVAGCLSNGAGGVNGTLNANAGSPTEPLTIVARRPDGGSVAQYYFWSGNNSGTVAYHNISLGGCGETSLNRGESSWVIIFDKPRSAFSIAVTIGNMLPGGRLHIQGHDTTGAMIMHQDIVAGGPDPDADFPHSQTFSWTTAPGVEIAALTTWVENFENGTFLRGPTGVRWLSVGLGTARDDEVPVPDPDPVVFTLEERVDALEERMDALEAFHP